MAVDEAILDAVRKDESLATLRLYAWDPPCLSLGYAQPVQDVDRIALAYYGWDLVRRPTGGRAILHTDELTYAVIGPPEDPRLAGSVLESYRCLASALLEALHLLDIPAEAHEKSPSDQPPLSLQLGSQPSTGSPRTTGAQNPVCFEVPSNYEITVESKKLVGSAQARRRDGVLQHGSLPLQGDLTRIIQAVKFAGEEERAEAARRLLARACTAEDVLGQPLNWDKAALAFQHAFEATLNIHFECGELTSAEERRADELVEEKYSHPRWTDRS
jgi:lipoate-protein ligase A